MFSPDVVFGYHGCDEDIARRVLEGAELKLPHFNPAKYTAAHHKFPFWEERRQCEAGLYADAAGGPRV